MPNWNEWRNQTPFLWSSPSSSLSFSWSLPLSSDSPFRATEVTVTRYSGTPMLSGCDSPLLGRRCDTEKSAVKDGSGDYDSSMLIHFFMIKKPVLNFLYRKYSQIITVLLTHSTLRFASICCAVTAVSRLSDQLAVHGAGDHRCERKDLQNKLRFTQPFF